MNRFYCSDTHFGHTNICKFTNRDGSKLRPWDSVEEMDEALIENWNSVVSTKDTVYLLGDVVINKKCLPTLHRLNGRKILVKGNHDIFDLKYYTEYFEDIRAYVVNTKDWFICSHIPVHESQLERFKYNVHGHLHGNTLEDPRYFSVCMEQINYTPIEHSEMLTKIKNKFDIV